MSPLSSVLYDAVIRFAELTGIWRYPIRCSGDAPRMGFVDKAYWLYKAARPTRHACRGSGLEAYFAEQRQQTAELPPGFLVDRELSLSAAGDLMHHAYLARSKDVVYRDVADLIFGADVSMANLECVVRRSKRSGADGANERVNLSAKETPLLYYDEADFTAAKGFEGKSFTFLAVASNHALDDGEAGLDGTLGVLRERGIAFVGATEASSDPFQATIVERDGIRIGAVAYTFGTNGRSAPEHRPYIVHRMALNDGVAANDFAQLTRQLDHCRREGVDFVVANLHWGLEHELYPRPEQLELAHHLAELGVDAIIGHHPHVLQPMELYRTRRDAHRLVPIYYSLGNLLNPFSAPDSCLSGVARLTLCKGKLEGATRVYVRSAELALVRQIVDVEQRQIRLLRVSESSHGRPTPATQAA